MLDVLGLDEAEERAYRRLIEMPSGTAEDLAGPLGYGPGQGGVHPVRAGGQRAGGPFDQRPGPLRRLPAGRSRSAR